MKSEQRIVLARSLLDVEDVHQYSYFMKISKWIHRSRDQLCFRYTRFTGFAESKYINFIRSIEPVPIAYETYPLCKIDVTGCRTHFWASRMEVPTL